MSTTLVCLLSDQHVPNLLSVYRFHPNRLLLVESSGMKKRNAAENFCHTLKIGGHFDQNCTKIVAIPKGKESDFQTLLATYGNVLKEASLDTEWIINLTGGNKPMSIAAYDIFSKAARRQFIYTDIGTPNRICDFLTGEETLCNNRLGIEEFLSGYGFEYQKPLEKVKVAESWAQKYAEVAIVMAKHAMTLRCWGDNALKDERKRVKEFMNLKSGKTLDLEEGDLIPTVDEVRNAFCEGFGFEQKGKSLLGKIDKYIAKFIDGGWLENFFWHVLEINKKELGLHEVHLGLEIRGKHDATMPHELDVTLMKDNYTFEFLECKSGSQEHDKKGDIFYRIESVRKMPGAGRTKSYLVTNSQTFSEDGNKLKTEALELRAKSYDCMPILGNAIERLASILDAATIREVFGWN